jgi:predicted amidohydrolase YtcJ
MTLRNLLPLAAGMMLALNACTENTGQSPSGDGLVRINAAHIYTMNPQQPEVDSLVYDAQGKILETGSRQALAEQYPDAEVIDFDNQTIIPGLIDAHGHLYNLGVTKMQADLVGAESLEAALERLQEHAQTLPEGSWLLGRGWDQNDWPGQEFPTNGDLDALFPDRPVWLRRVDGHAAWANSAAMAQVKQRLEGDWQPDGGLIMRNEDGVPNGIFIDGAMDLVDAAVPVADEELMERALDYALEETARFGLTGVHEAGTSWPLLQLYLKRSREGRLPLRVYAMADGANETLARLCEMGPIEDESGRVLARSVKLYADGALGSRGAAMIEPYTDAPETKGLLFHKNQALLSLVAKAMGCGLQVNTHAIGDAANEQVLDTYQDAMEQVPNHLGRHRIEHAQVVQVSDISRFRELGLIASMQPTHATSDMPWAEQRVGAERILGAYAWQRFISAAVPLALGSDFPVESANPLFGLYSAVARSDHEGMPEEGWYPEQRLSIEQALAGFTRDAAYAAFMENEVGQLKAGLRADFVVLDENIMAMEPEEILSLDVMSTWIDGAAVYQRP